MIIQIVALFFTLFSCQGQTVKSKSMAKPKTAKVAVAKKIANIFEGNYSGTHNEKEIFISLKETAGTSTINGVLMMDGKQAQITAEKVNSSFSGKIVEDDTQKKYNITASMVNRKLHFNITFPEYNNQVLALILDRSTLILNGNSDQTTINSNGGQVTTTGGNVGSSSKSINRDRAMVGKWRFTEVINSGRGQFCLSFSTDYFLQFNANGSCTTWTGKSAGGSGNVSFESNDGTNIENANWYTEGKNVVFVNLDTNKKMSIPYYAEQNRMILKGNLNRVYTRIE